MLSTIICSIQVLCLWWFLLVILIETKWEYPLKQAMFPLEALSPCILHVLNFHDVSNLHVAIEIHIWWLVHSLSIVPTLARYEIPLRIMGHIAHLSRRRMPMMSSNLEFSGWCLQFLCCTPLCTISYATWSAYISEDILMVVIYKMFTPIFGIQSIKLICSWN